jgi:hypothetical protein
MLGAMALPGAALAATNADIVTSIDKALANLASQQNADGSWNYGGYNQAITGAAVSAFLSQQSLWGSNAAAYQTIVNNGMNYLLGTAALSTVTTRLDGSAACPGGVASCNGVYWYGSGETTYTTGLVAQSIAQYGALKGAGSVATLSGPLGGLTWGQISQGVVNVYTAGQTTVNNTLRGGWRYAPGTQDSDGSTTQWAVISSIFGASLGAQTPPIVKSELNNYWLANIQAGDGSGCYQPGYLCEFSDTGSLLLGLAFVGKGTSDAQVQKALNWLNTNWTQATDGGWYGNFGNPYAMYAVYKSLSEQIGKTDNTWITNLSSCGTLDPGVACNWWQNYNQWLVSNQNGDGSWNGVAYWTGPLATAFDVQVLGGEYIPPAGGVPEPSTWVMMLAGFAGLGFLGYRRNKAASVAA